MTSHDADDDPAARSASLQPARRAIVARQAGAATMVAVLLVAFLAATATLPPWGALAVGLLIAAGALWAIRWASRAAQAGLLATPDGVVLRLGTASAEIGWEAVDAIRVLGDSRLVAVEVLAGRLRRQLPPVYPSAETHRWLRAAADLAAEAGHPELNVHDGELTAAE